MAKILEKNGVNNTNIDGARFNNFCAGERCGIIKSTLNECAITTPSSSVINIETGELLVSGVRVVLNNPKNFTFSTMPTNATRYSLIAEIVIDANSDITSRIFVQLANSALVQNDLFKTENGAGTYQIELAKFTLTNDGIEDLVRTVDIITGSKSGGNGLVNIGTVETETLAEGLDAEVDIETVFNAEDNKYYTNFQFHIPKGDTGEQGIQGIQGETGNGITTIAKTGTSGLTDTYTITFTSGETTTFNVSNGKGIASITKTGTSGLVDTYTVAFNDSTSTTFTVTNGEKGDKGNTGLTPNLQIGNTTTLETGQPATVTITGTTDNPILNLGLPKGNTGSQGIQGKSYVPKGEWSSATAYVNNATTIDTVLYLGSTYYCKQSNTNQTPTNTTYWGLLAEKGLDTDIIVSQTTGESETAIMSQKAVSDELKTCERIQNYVIFESDEPRTITPKYTQSGVTLQYSIDKGESWVNIAHNTATPSSAEIWFRGQATGNKSLFTSDTASNAWSFSGDSTNKLSVKGNLNYLLCDNLGDISAPTTLASVCYGYMFYNCTSLTKAPDLPATTLASYCYFYMFYNCTSLTKAPDLPATTLASVCYDYMFYNCTSLTKAPDLPATTLASYCYSGMFYNCTSLTKAPYLPATTLASYCYSGMFRGCTSLTKAPELPATTLANDCYDYMFQDCTSLTQIKCYYPSNLSNVVAQNWLSGIHTIGTIYSPNGVITYGKPTNWTSQDLTLSATATIGEIYPIGAIYISVVSTSPASLFGGTWQQLKDRFLLAAGDTYVNGSTGGAATHTLSTSEMPAHTHDIFAKKGPEDFGGQYPLLKPFYPSGPWQVIMTDATELTGGGSAHNNMPPYITVYIWKRTA